MGWDEIGLVGPAGADGAQGPEGPAGPATATYSGKIVSSNADEILAPGAGSGVSKLTIGLIEVVWLAYVASGAINPARKFHNFQVQDANPMNMTFSPEFYVEYIFTVYSTAGGSVVITLDGSYTWDGTNNKATFTTPGQLLKCIRTSPNRVSITANVGVTFSS